MIVVPMTTATVMMTTATVMMATAAVMMATAAVMMATATVMMASVNWHDSCQSQSRRKHENTKHALDNTSCFIATANQLTNNIK